MAVHKRCHNYWVRKHPIFVWLPANVIPSRLFWSLWFLLSVTRQHFSFHKYDFIRFLVFNTTIVIFELSVTLKQTYYCGLPSRYKKHLHVECLIFNEACDSKYSVEYASKGTYIKGVTQKWSFVEPIPLMVHRIGWNTMLYNV